MAVGFRFRNGFLPPWPAGIAAARRLGAKLASLIGIAEVFFAVLYAWLLLGQRPSAMEFTGGAFILAASSWYALMRISAASSRADPSA
jgi:drug/metabolite transporter (DMT)-like permease